MHSPDAAAIVLGELRAFGVQVYLDDLGRVLVLELPPSVPGEHAQRSIGRLSAASRDTREQPAIVESMSRWREALART